MKLIAPLLAALAVLSAPPALAAGSTAGLQNTDCVAPGSSASLYKTQSAPKYAKLFGIEYHDTYKVLSDHSSKSTYVLYQCGSDKPSVKDAAAFIPIPVSSVAAWSTTAPAFLEALGVQDKIRNLGTSPSITSACLQELLQEVIKPFDEGNATSVDQQEMNNTVVFNMPGGQDANTTNTVYSAEYLEGSALGRAEWLKYFAAFFNAEERANALFDSISANYECFAGKANSEYNALRPVVAWTSYAEPSAFNNNTAYWQISTASYKYDLVRDAGARMLNTTGGASATTFKTAAAFLDALKDADIVIDESFVSYSYADLLKNYGVSDPGKSDLVWVSQSRVFRPDRIQSTAGGLDWFEAPLVFADALLQDVIGVAHPAFSKKHSAIWFRNLAKDDPVSVISAANCTDMYAQRQDIADTCSSVDFQPANPSDSDYSGVEPGKTQDPIYDISKSKVINDESGAASLCAGLALVLVAAAAAAATVAL
ncbi:hypothetical protein H4R18_001258 [Coemansia javaensis]|uniref:Periplasmic binding protein n=1 Tax=Coemansia javaensis TaxID=2761396 RepID=A0A9W8LJF0_9FUNG|nr:hypothetical protein H4R18_001258 [Coemansia javaensis]